MMVEAAQWAADQFAAGKPGNRAVRNAFIAWWACEDGYDWPTNSRNNPGNLRPAGDSTGSVGVTASNFYIYATPGDGVAMHVQRVKRSTHYPMIRSAISQVANNQVGPAAIADAVGRSPWGTNAPCMRSALGYIAKQIDYAASPTGTGWATVHRLGAGAGGGSSSDATLASATSTCHDLAVNTLRKAGVSTDPAHVFTDGDYQALFALYYPHGGFPGALDGIKGAFGRTVAEWLKKADDRDARGENCAVGGSPDPLAAVGDIGAAISQLPEQLGNVVVHLVPVVVAAALIVIGLYLLVTAER